MHFPPYHLIDSMKHGQDMLELVIFNVGDLKWSLVMRLVSPSVNGHSCQGRKKSVSKVFGGEGKHLKPNPNSCSFLRFPIGLNF